MPGVDTCPYNCSICEYNGGGYYCVAPTPTLIPTQPPLCGQSCSPGVDSCPVECPHCAPDASSGQIVCRQQASCNCDGFSFTGRIEPGSPLTFTTYAKVEDPDNNNAEVRYVTYHLEQDGTEIVNSGQIPVGVVQRTTDVNGAPIDRYSADWNYTIPGSLSGPTTYRAYAQITCGYKTQVAPQAVPQPNVIERIWNFFLQLMGVDVSQAASQRIKTSRSFTFNASEQANYKTVTPMSFDRRSVKLGTFDPLATPTPYIALGCKQMVFTVNK